MPVPFGVRAFIHGERPAALPSVAFAALHWGKGQYGDNGESCLSSTEAVLAWQTSGKGLGAPGCGPHSENHWSGPRIALAGCGSAWPCLWQPS